MEKTLALASLLLVACTSAPAPTNDGERGTWKASTKSDYPATCAGACGGRSRGLCYCDPACSAWGDCCPDYAPVCESPSYGDGGIDASDSGFATGPTGPTGPFYGSDLGGPTGPFYDTSDLGGPTGATGPFYGTSDLGGPSGATGPSGPSGTSGPINKQFVVDLTPDRTSNWGDGGTTAPAVHNICTVKGYPTSVTVDCGGSSYAYVDPSGTATGFMIYMANGGLIAGSLPASLDFVYLYYYSYLSPDSSYHDDWTGPAMPSLTDISSVRRKFSTDLVVTPALTAHIECTLTQTGNGPFYVDCGNGAAEANPSGGSFYTTLPNGDILTGEVLSESTVQLLTYTRWPSDIWTGALLLSTNPF